MIILTTILMTMVMIVIIIITIMTETMGRIVNHIYSIYSRVLGSLKVCGFGARDGCAVALAKHPSWRKY